MEYTLTDNYIYIFDLDGEKVDLILVRSAECTQVPVKDDSAAIETDTDLTRRDALVADIEGNTLLEVAASLRDGDWAEDGDIDLSDDLNAEVDEVIVDHDLIGGSRQNNTVCKWAKAYVERANGDTIELVAVCADVVDVEVIREVLSRGGEAFSACLRALDEDSGAALAWDGLYTLLEEGGDH